MKHDSKMRKNYVCEAYDATFSSLKRYIVLEEFLGHPISKELKVEGVLWKA